MVKGSMLLANLSVLISGFLRTYAPVIDELAACLIIVAAAILVSAILRRLINRLRESNYIAPVMARRLQSFQRLAILFLTVLILLQVAGVFGSAWAVISAGLAAIAVGFVAVWSMLGNATAALLVLTFRPFRIGDTVELIESSGAGVGGRVVAMNLMYTTLSLPSVDGEQATEEHFLQIPNSLFFQRILRIRSSHKPDSEATFFSQAE